MLVAVTTSHDPWWSLVERPHTMTEFDTMRSSRKGFLRKFHYGLVSVSDGKCRPQASRIKLCSDYITLQREEFHIWEDEDTYNVEAGLRTVELPRGEDGTLGLSIKGGREYNLPILVSRVTSECDRARWDSQYYIYLLFIIHFSNNDIPCFFRKKIKRHRLAIGITSHID